MTFIQNQYILGLAAKGARIDGRGAHDYRPIHIDVNPISNPEGCARVKIGGTEVLVGVKMAVEKPYPDRPNEGMLIVNAEFSPLASPVFETGPPREDAVELARVVDRGIRESHAIDTERLCIKEGEEAWAVYIDIQIINHNGGLLDAAALGAVVALWNAKTPGWDGKLVDYSKKKDKLPMVHKPIAVTFAKLGNAMFMDTGLDEESVLDGKITITTKDDGNVCAIQKSGPCSFTLEEIEKAVEDSMAKGKELRKLF